MLPHTRSTSLASSCARKSRVRTWAMFSCHTAVATVKALAVAGLVQGLLCTPTSLAEDGEYRELCEFAVRHRAGYVLLNPLSSMGRGVKARSRLAATEERMRNIHQLTAPFAGAALSFTPTRFPRTAPQPLPPAPPP